MPEVFSLEQTQAEDESLGRQIQKRLEAASQILRKRDLERDQLTQPLNQLDSESQDTEILEEKSSDTVNIKKSTTIKRYKI